MRISVFGSMNMDMTVTAERIPERGETVMGGELHCSPGGKGANQAVAMSRLGAKVTMFGCVGNDRNGEILLNNLRQYGVETRYIKIISNIPTGVAIITTGDQDNTIVVAPGANDMADCSYADSIMEELLQSDAVVLQHEIPLETVRYLIDICYSKGVPVILNPAPARPISDEIMEKVAYLTPNEHEARFIFGVSNYEDIIRKYPEKVVVTLGEKGAAVCLKNGEILNVPSMPVKVVDTTGAGDAFNGAFCVMICEGMGMEQALRFANAAAGLSTEKSGAQMGMPNRSEILKSGLLSDE